MSDASPEAIKQQVRLYLKVFAALMVLTCVTVAVSYIHFSVALGIFVALAIASLKGGMVAGFFMHLSHEKPIIYWILIMTFLFFVILMTVPMITIFTVGPT